MTLSWHALSVTEVSGTTDRRGVLLRLGPDTTDWLTVDPAEILLIRVHQPAPDQAWMADSPVQSLLPVLRELIGLTMHSTAEIDSRLGGAGILWLPESVRTAIRANAVASGRIGPDDDIDPFVEDLIAAMVTPISDRSSASAVVPLVVTAPDDAVDKPRFMRLDGPLDEFLEARREQAIRRIALGMDAPPEMLTGTGSMNHWGAWLLEESKAKTHLAPLLSLICDAITTQYLRPALDAAGWHPDRVARSMVWFDLADLSIQPTRAADAATLHAAGVISDGALRAAHGFEESDAPDPLPPAAQIALDLVRASPALMAAPGLGAVVEQVQAALDGRSASPAAVPADPGTVDDGGPPRQILPPDPPGVADGTPGA